MAAQPKLVVSHALSTTPKMKHSRETPHRTRTYAQALLESIELELGDAAYFTREDLLHVSAFSHVATITRYKYVCDTVQYLIRTNKVIVMSQTELALTRRGREYVNRAQRNVEYMPTIRRLFKEATLARAKGEFITVMDVVRLWTTDQHLTTNVKRVIARDVMRQLVSERVMSATGLGKFLPVTKDS